LEVFVKERIAIASAFKCRTPKLGATDEKTMVHSKDSKKVKNEGFSLKFFAGLD